MKEPLPTQPAHQWAGVAAPHIAPSSVAIKTLDEAAEKPASSNTMTLEGKSGCLLSVAGKTSWLVVGQVAVGMGGSWVCVQKNGTALLQSIDYKK